MKKYTKIAYVFILLLIILFGFIVYKTISKKDSKDDLREKAVSEIKHLENKFQDLFNEINNITFENYKISSTKIEKEDNKEQNSGSSEASGGEGGAGSSKQGGGSDSSSGNSKSSENNVQYQLEETGILNNDSDINWKNIKTEVENMYTSLYSTTIDLYQVANNQEDIVNFNKEYDKLTMSVKNENKQDTLMELSNLYEYLPKFTENVMEDEKDKIIIKTKNHIFKAYSILEQEDWQSISNNVDKAIQEITKLVTNVNSKEKVNQYNINKAYIIINELQEAISLKDKDIFLIKYKNLLEELKNI